MDFNEVFRVKPVGHGTAAYLLDHSLTPGLGLIQIPWLGVALTLLIFYRTVQQLDNSGGLPPQSPGGRDCLCVCFFFNGFGLCCYVFSSALYDIYFIHLWHDIAYLC